MSYYAIQVLTGGESDYTRRASPLLARGRLLAPKRVLAIRKGGRKGMEESPVFPGYVFVEIDDLLASLPDYWSLRRARGFVRFLRDTASPTPLAEKDLALLRHFMSFGERADTSKVTFDENDRIVVLEGPLKGLEGSIVKVDRRKGRAKVALDICETGFLIDLGFEAAEKVSRGGGPGHEES